MALKSYVRVKTCLRLFRMEKPRLGRGFFCFAGKDNRLPCPVDVGFREFRLSLDVFGFADVIRAGRVSSSASRAFCFCHVFASFVLVSADAHGDFFARIKIPEEVLPPLGEFQVCIKGFAMSFALSIAVAVGDPANDLKEERKSDEDPVHLWVAGNLTKNDRKEQHKGEYDKPAHGPPLFAILLLD